MRKSHTKPKNEQDFELLCLKLLRAYQKCPELELYAKRGQSQHGVDIVDLSGREPLCGAQCKLHEEGRVTTPTEISKEILKARRFVPPLDQYIIMTTGKVRKEVHDLLIQVNREHRKEKLFIVKVFDWCSIEELLDEYTDVREWYECGLSVAAVGRIESQLDMLNSKIGQISEPYRSGHGADGFHADIDEAKRFLDKHEYQIAKLLLRRIKVQNWDRLSSREKFRVLTNLAAVESSTDNHTRAAELCLEAKQYQPTDEAACINEALSYLTLDQRERAFELAGKLKNEFPYSASAMGAFILSAPEKTSLQSLEQSVPENLLLKDEIAIALTYRALDSDDLQSAERFIRPATVRKSPVAVPWLLLGQIILQSEILGNYQEHGTEPSACDQDRLREAEHALSEALSRATEGRSSAETLEALLGRCRTRYLLNENTKAREDIEEARRVAPNDPRVIELYGESLRIEGKADDAIAFMRSVPEERLSYYGRLALSALLIERGRSEDYLMAGGLLSQIAKTATKLPEDIREQAIEMSLEAFARQSRFETAENLLKELPSETVSPVALKTLTARLHFLAGDQEKASKSADHALTLTDDTAAASDIRRLARTFSVLGRFNDALPLLKRIYVPGVLSDDTRLLLEVSDRLNRHNIMLDIFRDLRESGVADRTLLDVELSLLETYDTEAALKILESELRLRPEDVDLKLEQSLIGIELDRPDLIDLDPADLPKSSEVEPQTALKAVRVLRMLGHDEFAIQYAYDVVRYNFIDPAAHSVFIQALMSFPAEPQVNDFDTVQLGAAVCYVDQHDDSNARWIIVEDLPYLASQAPEQELTPDHEICKEMMGKRAGDSFLLSKGIQNRYGTIKAVQNKYIYRFQDCVGQWQIRFPDIPSLQTVMIQKKSTASGESEMDFDAIKIPVDIRHKQVTKLSQLYMTSPLPLHLFGHQFGKNSFEALVHFATTPNTAVKCCTGSSEEHEYAAKAFRSCNTVILDLSAIASIFLLNSLGLLKRTAKDLVVSQGTVNEIRRMISDDSWFRGGTTGMIFKTETGIAVQEDTDEGKSAYIQRLRDLVKVLETTCRVESSTSLAEVVPESRKTLVDGFGHYGAESILLSSVPGALLWTDDHVQAQLARQSYGVSRVWTQFVIRAYVDSGIVEPAAFFDASAKFLGFDYHFTSASPEIIRHAGMMADWKIDSWPLSQALSVFGSDLVDLEQIRQLAAGFLKLLYQESILPETKTNVTVRVLENMATKDGGIQGIEMLKRALPSILGVNVVGLADATRTIDGWLKAVRDRLRRPVGFR